MCYVFIYNHTNVVRITIKPKTFGDNFICTRNKMTIRGYLLFLFDINCVNLTIMLIFAGYG